VKRKLALLVFLAGAYFALPPTPLRAIAGGSVCSGAGDCGQFAIPLCGSAGVQTQCCCGIPGGGGNYCNWVCSGSGGTDCDSSNCASPN
jgi:hypothetical protein